MIKKITKKEWFEYTVAFMVCLMILAIPFVKMHRGFINEGDGFNQSFPVFVYTGQWLRACIRGEMRLFDFRIGLGDDVIAALNWHGFGDITQLLSVFFPYRYVEWGYALTMVLKLWLCGLSFLIYARRYIKGNRYRILGALAYAFSSYSLLRGFNCWMFLVPMMTLPLIWCGVDELCSREKSYSYHLLLGLWIQSLNGFYFLYIEVILTIIYFLIYELCHLEGRDGKSSIVVLFRDGFHILGQAIIAICLGAPLLIPSVMGFLNSNRSGDLGEKYIIRDLLLYPFSYYSDIVSEIIIPRGGNLTLGFLVIFGLFLAFCIKKDRNVMMHKLLFGTFGVLAAVPLWGSITNGFSYVSDRWVFCIILVDVILAVMGIEKNDGISKKQTGIFYTLAGILLGYYIWSTRGEQNKTIIVIYIIIGLVLPIMWNLRKKWIFFFGTALVILNGLVILISHSYGGVGYTWGFLTHGAASGNVNEIIDTFEDSSSKFERREACATSLGASLIKSYYGTTEYLSTLNGSTYDFFRELYISPGIGGATWVLKGLDGRKELEALLSVGQSMDYSTKEDSFVYNRNEAVLPLGIAYSSSINRAEFNTLNPMEKQTVLLNNIVLEDVSRNDMDEDSQLQISELNREIEFMIETQNIEQSLEWIMTEQNAKMRVYVEKPLADIGEKAGRELYVQLYNLRLLNEGPVDISVGNKTIQLRNQKDNYYTGVDEFWINLTELYEDEKGTYFEILLPEDKIFSLEEVHVYEHTINNMLIEERKEYMLSDFCVDTNRIYGRAEMKEDGMILFTVPYSKGWTAYVDGERQKIYKADVGFLAVKVNKGEHMVALKYDTPGLFPGGILFIIGLLFLAMIVIRKKHNQLDENLIEKQSSGV